MKMKIKTNNNLIFDKTISLNYSLKVLKELVQFKDILKSIELDLIDKKTITLNFENNEFKCNYTFYNLTKNTYNKLDIQIIKLFF